MKNEPLSQKNYNFKNEGGLYMSTKTMMKESVVHDPMLPLGGGHYQHIGLKNLGRRLAGTYLLREPLHDDERVLLRLVTLMEDGTWVSSHSHQHAKEFGFTTQQGVWEAIGTREVSAKVIDFNYNPEGGCPNGVSKIGFIMEWSDDYQAVQGDVFGERYNLDQDPLNSGEVSKATFGHSFTGHRVMVDEFQGS